MPPGDAEALYEAITDKIFFEELSFRLDDYEAFVHNWMAVTKEQAQLIAGKELSSIVKWEYLFVDVDYPATDDGRTRKEGLLNEVGRDGWELVSVNSRLAYFKRPK